MMIKLKWDSEGGEQVLLNHGMLDADFAIENLSGLDPNIFFVSRSCAIVARYQYNVTTVAAYALIGF